MVTDFPAVSLGIINLDWHASNIPAGSSCASLQTAIV
jgi:hypothetical protein